MSEGWKPFLHFSDVHFLWSTALKRVSHGLQLTYRRGEGAGKGARMCNSWETAPHVRGVTQKVEQGIVRMIDLLNLREEKVALQLLTYATHRVHAKGRHVMPTRAPRPMTTPHLCYQVPSRTRGSQALSSSRTKSPFLYKSPIFTIVSSSKASPHSFSSFKSHCN